MVPDHSLSEALGACLVAIAPKDHYKRLEEGSIVLKKSAAGPGRAAVCGRASAAGHGGGGAVTPAHGGGRVATAARGGGRAERRLRTAVAGARRLRAAAAGQGSGGRAAALGTAAAG